MPVGKYHCDYCDKEFHDLAAARKRHLQGIQHQRNRALWYDSFNKGLSNPSFPDPGHFATCAQGIVRGVCNRFLNTGACPYGDSCKYTHPRQNLPVQSVNAQGRFPIAGNTDTQSFGVPLGSLPPSLRPPPEGGYPPLPFFDWGSNMPQC